MDHPEPRHCLYLGVPIGLSAGSLSRVSHDVGPRIGRAAHGDDGTRRPVASSGWAGPVERAFRITFARRLPVGADGSGVFVPSHPGSHLLTHPETSVVADGLVDLEVCCLTDTVVRP